ncbi:MAG: hypothetical protein R8P61_34360 [Bacteroidia bacterium]|nr:hypothetical protein [Bacteroidia bacterium]
MKTIKHLIFLSLVLIFFSCTDDSILDSPNQAPEINPRFQKTQEVIIDQTSRIAKSASNAEQFMADVNNSLQAQGLALQMSAIESYGADGMGTQFFFNNTGNKQLTADFVPGDARRGGFIDIAFARDGTEGATSSGLTQGDTDAAILSAMNTWDNITCSQGLVLNNLGSSGFDLGYVEALVTGGAQGSFFFTDLMHSGFNTTVTDAVFGPGSSVLGVAFTFVWIDLSTGLPTDIDNNGKDDVAFRDIYYNDSFSWAIGANIDVETVALHEAGHGLSQAHFGKLHQTGNGKFHFSPRAVMNAGYTGVNTVITATDNAGHCSNWGSWPNN